MKFYNFFLLLTLISTPTFLNAQKNSVQVGYQIGFFGTGDYRSSNFNLEYSRQIKGNWEAYTNGWLSFPLGTGGAFERRSNSSRPNITYVTAETVDDFYFPESFSNQKGKKFRH